LYSTTGMPVVLYNSPEFLALMTEYALMRLCATLDGMLMMAPNGAVLAVMLAEPHVGAILVEHRTALTVSTVGVAKGTRVANIAAPIVGQ
jgi:hypothetical protein